MTVFFLCSHPKNKKIKIRTEAELTAIAPRQRNHATSAINDWRKYNLKGRKIVKKYFNKSRGRKKRKLATSRNKYDNNPSIRENTQTTEILQTYMVRKE